MKLPKELQKKKKTTALKERKFNFTDSFIEAFKERFKELKKKFNDKRNLEYIDEIDNMSVKTSIKPRFSIKWNEEKIQVSIFKESIKIINEIIKKLIKDMNLNELHKQIANHEYGHILSARTAYDLFPEKAREYNLFELTQEQLIQMHYSPLENKLEQVSIDRLFGTFLEFLANYNVRELIDSNPPFESLKSKTANNIDFIREMRTKGDFSLHNPYPSSNKMEKGFDRFFLFHSNSVEFYLFNKWDDFCSTFKGLRIKGSLKLMKIINNFFEKIILINNDIHSMKNDVIELAKNLNRLDFIQLIQSNQLTNKDKAIIREFLNYLSIKLKHLKDESH
jgi:hypothetical protein